MPTALLGRLKTIAGLVIEQMNDASQKLATDTRILAYVNECIADVATQDYWKTEATLTLVSGVGSYDMLALYPTFLSFGQNTSAVINSTTDLPLNPLQTLGQYQNCKRIAASGTPYYWWAPSNVLKLIPVPDAALDLELHFLEKPAARTSRDLKLTIDRWVQDSAATGHFVDAADATLTLGEGNDCPEVIEGTTVSLVAGEFQIETITGDGSGAGAVELAGSTPTEDVLAVYDPDATNPPWPEPFDTLLAVPFVKGKIFESDATHVNSAGLATANMASYLRQRNRMTGAALPVGGLRPPR